MIISDSEKQLPAKDTFRRFSVNVQIAGVTATIATDYPETLGFLKDYITAEPPSDSFCISVTDEEIQAKRNGLSGKTLSDPAIEHMLIHSAFSQHALARDVLLFHGSAICMDGQCYIFTAPSGTGKSTHAALWREAFGERCCIINDDKPYLICKDDGITVCGSPWNGKHGLGKNISAPLKAISVLKRSEDNRIERISPAAAYGVMYQQSYRPEPAEGQRSVMKLLARVAGNAAFYNLYCNMSPDAATVAYEGICAASGYAISPDTKPK